MIPVGAREMFNSEHFARCILATGERQWKSSRYLLSPAKLQYTVRRFERACESFGIEGISLADLANQLHADYRERANAPVDGQQAEGIVAEQVRRIGLDQPVMLKGCNVYALGEMVVPAGDFVTGEER